MANTLTNLIPDIYAALDVVSRELVGFIPSVTMDSQASRVAVGQNLRIPIVPSNAAGGDFVPAMAFPSAAYQTIAPVTLTINKQRHFPFSWVGSEQAAVNSGLGFLTLRQQQIAQAIRAAVNEIEVDLATAAYQNASRAYGTAGTAPFDIAGDYTDAAEVRKILDDNGAPLSERSLVVSTAAGAKLRAKQAQAYMAGDNALQRQGVLFDIAGFMVRESAQVVSHTKGAGVDYVFAAAGGAVGQTTLTVEGGTVNATGIKAGDVITHADDPVNKYMVNAGTTSAAGDIVIGNPGLLVEGADAGEITIGDSYVANVAFSRNAILLVTRLPDMPDNGDMATDSLTMTDPNSGLSFEVRSYPGVGMETYLLLINWGVKVIKPEHVAVLLGSQLSMIK